MNSNKKSGKDPISKKNDKENGESSKDYAKLWAYFATVVIGIGWIFGWWSPSLLVVLGIIVSFYVAAYLLASAAIPNKKDKKSRKNSKTTKIQPRRTNTENLTVAFIITSALLVVLLGVEKLDFWKVPKEYILIIGVGIFVLSYFIKAVIFSKNKKANVKNADE